MTDEVKAKPKPESEDFRHGRSLCEGRELRLPALPDDEIRKIVLELAEGRALSNWQVPPDMWSMVFMPLFLGGLEPNDGDWPVSAETMSEEVRAGYLAQYRKDLGALIGFQKDESQRYINGYPMYFAMTVVSVTDWARIRKAVDRFQELRGAFEV